MCIMAERSEPISFRLPSTYAKDLAKRAEIFGDSLGEHARRIVVDALTDADRQIVRDEVQELRKLVETLREDFATAVAVLLSRREPYSRDEAEAWVKKTLLR